MKSKNTNDEVLSARQTFGFHTVRWCCFLIFLFVNSAFAQIAIQPETQIKISENAIIHSGSFESKTEGLLSISQDAILANGEQIYIATGKLSV